MAKSSKPSLAAVSRPEKGLRMSMPMANGRPAPGNPGTGLVTSPVGIADELAGTARAFADAQNAMFSGGSSGMQTTLHKPQ